MQKKEDKYKLEIDKAWKCYQEKNLSEAKKICIKLKKSFPDKLGSNYLMVVIYFEEKEFQKSVVELKEALQKDKDNKAGGFINYWLGKNYGEKTFSFDKNNPLYNKDTSRKFYEKALEFENCPEDVVNQLNYLYQNDYKIIQLFKIAVVKFPENLNFHLALAHKYKKLEQFENQESTLRNANEKFKSTHLLYEIAKIEITKKLFKESRNTLQLAESYSQNQQAVFALQLSAAKSYKEEGNIEKAEELYLSAFNIEKNSDNFWFGLFGVLMCENGPDFVNFSELLSRMEVTKQFIIEDWFGDMPIYFDTQHFIDIELTATEDELLTKLNLVKKSCKEKDILGKIELMKSSLYKQKGDNSNRLKSIKESINLLDTYHYDFLLQEYAETISNVFYSLIEEDKPIENILTEIITTLEDQYSFRAIFLEHLEGIIEELHRRKQYRKIINLFEIYSESEIDKIDIWFEVGYAYNEVGNQERAKYSYNRFIEKKGETSAVLNNLANILKGENKLDRAISMYQKALSIVKDDKLVKKNLEDAIKRQKAFIKEADKKRALDKLFLNAISLLKSENFFNLETLHNFILNCKKEEEFDDWKLPIQEEMFPVLMHTNLRKANELKENWLSKNYIALTDDSDEYNIPVFLINPYIETEINRLRNIVNETSLPQEWLNGLNNITTFQLDELDYSSTIKRISKVNSKYRLVILRDFNELVFNYLVGNKKATIVLAGSFVELILTYYCDRKKYKQISYPSPTGKIINKGLYDCVLFDLISFIEEKKYFGNDFLPLSNLSRVYRNYVHPGVELKESIDKTKSDLCFISSLEILRKVI